jgi:hypothetical protein
VLLIAVGLLGRSAHMVLTSPELSSVLCVMHRAFVIAGVLMGCLGVWLFCVLFFGVATTSTSIASVSMPSLGEKPAPQAEVPQPLGELGLPPKQPCTIWRCG